MRKLFVLTTVLMLALTFSTLMAAPVQAAATSDIVVQTIPGPTVAEKVTSRAKSSWPWYLARGSGLVAAASLIILALSGIGMVTGYTFRFLEPLTAWASHRALGLAFGVSVLVHIFSLLFDRFVPFNIWQLFVPWLSSYRPVTLFGYRLGSLYVALGIIAFYGVLLIIVSSLLWIEKKPYTWKLLHLATYFVLLLVFVHALYLGTDLSHGLFRKLWILLCIVVLGAILHRLRRARTA